MNSVYLIDGCRSPIGKGNRETGLYRELRADDLAAQTLKVLLARIPFDPGTIDDFYLGCVGQHLEQGKNLARLVLLLSGLPEQIPGVTINRLCASSFTALQMAADSIASGTNNAVLVGGVEHMGHVPMTAALDYNQELFTETEFQWTNMGLTAEKLASMYDIGREEQESFAIESNRKYFTALKDGCFENEIVSVELADQTQVTVDQTPRESTPEKLATLAPVFKENGTVTAATSSPIADGACMALVCDQNMLEQNGWEPLAKIVSVANIGLDPSVMGLGPVYAIEKLLKQNGLTLNDIDLFEINEAFASQLIACQRELKIPPARLNVNGGALALGHPLGMSGLRIAVTLAHAMKKRDARYGIASMCVGHGQGVAMLLQRG